jgi:hypothetical protein
MSHGVLRPSGHLITTPLDGGPETVQDTVQCVHCGGHWIVQPGSGKIRGYCGNCAGPICGPGCAVCVGPWEARMENIEAGRPEATPRRILVCSGWERVSDHRPVPESVRRG